jgi:hypothetical protein
MDATVVFTALVLSFAGSVAGQLPGETAPAAPTAQPTFVEVYLAEPSSAARTEIATDESSTPTENPVVSQPVVDQPSELADPAGIDAAPQDQIEPLFVAEQEATTEPEPKPVATAPLDEPAMAPQDVALPVDLPPEMPAEQSVDVPDSAESDSGDSVFVETIPSVIVEEVQILEDAMILNEQPPAVLDSDVGNENAVIPETITAPPQSVEPEGVAIPEPAESAERAENRKDPFEAEMSETESAPVSQPEAVSPTSDDPFAESPEQFERGVDPFEVFDRIEVVPATEGQTIDAPQVIEEGPEVERRSDAPLSTL